MNMTRNVTVTQLLNTGQKLEGQKAKNISSYHRTLPLPTPARFPSILFQ